MSKNQFAITQVTVPDKSRFIQQSGSRIELGVQHGQLRKDRQVIECGTPISARKLALELSGIKESHGKRREQKFRKLATHPWYGQVIFNDLTEDDRQYIVIFIRKNKSLSDEEYRTRIHRLFLDDPNKPENHALIQEVVSLCL